MPKKILVVDDEKPISDIIKFNLTKEGFDVDTAYDGEEAVKKVEEYNPDLMILDLMLPKKDGLEVAREVRQTHDMPIIMVTAKDTEIDKVLGLEMGADAVGMQRITPVASSFKNAGEVISHAVYPLASKVARSPPEGKEEASGSPLISSFPENSIIILPLSSGCDTKESCFSAVIPVSGWNQ